jgi:CubicO group peptidase (beta-lactamase class C family)
VPKPICTLCPIVLLILSANLLQGQETPQALAVGLDAYLEPLVAMDLFSGAVLIARGDEILVHKAYGLADRTAGIANTPETRFKLMSVSKSLTGVAVMRLVQLGKLTLTDPVGRHLTDWPATWREITVHDLLDHTSGIPNLEREWGVASRAGKERGLPVWRRFAPQAGRPLQTQPGTVHRYSNFNTVLSGVVAEAVTGKSYPDLMRETVLGPAGMSATGFDDGSRIANLAIGYFRGGDGAPDPSQQDMSHIQPAGGFWSTVGDLYRLDRVLRGDGILDAETRTRMVTPRSSSSSYACCWLNRPVHGHACVQHSGGSNGYVADFLRFVDDDACVVVLSNYAFAPITHISHDLAAILFGVDYAQPQTPDAAKLDACTGVYQWPGAEMLTVVRRSGKTLLEFFLLPGSERCGGNILVPIGDATFAGAMGGARLVVESDARPPRIRRVINGQEMVLTRVDVSREAWLEAVGEFESQPRIGEGVRIVSEQGRLWLRIDGGWPRKVEIVPVGSEVAMTLFAADGGTFLRRHGKLGDAFSWHRVDGTRVILERRKPR